MIRVATITSFVMFILILFLTVSHKAVAADLAPVLRDDISLSEVAVISPKSKDKILVTCPQLKARVQDLYAEILADGEAMAHYTQTLSQAYSVWHVALNSYEDQRHAWGKDNFKPLENSAKNIDQSSEELYSWVDIYGQEIEDLVAGLNQCWPEGEKRKALTEKLSGFSIELSDCQTSTAGFLSDMKTRLKDWTRMWKSLEGTEAKVPTGYFYALRKDSDDLNEASQLFHENAQLLSEHLLPILRLFDATEELH
jgi:hypothetical protein